MPTAPAANEVYIYFSDDGGPMAGFIVATTTDRSFASSESFKDGLSLKDFYYETVRITPTPQEPCESSSRTLWLVLSGWDMDVSRWEEFEADGMGASWDRSTAERILQSLEPTGNFVIVGLSDGWRYGFDPVPQLSYPASEFDIE